MDFSAFLGLGFEGVGDFGGAELFEVFAAGFAVA